MILLDTNVLIYATDADCEHHAVSKQIVDAVIEGRERGAILPQILVEFIAATTGPFVARPLTAAEAAAQAEAFRSQITTLHPPASAVDELTDIVRATGRAGRRTFDCFLAAQARSLGISTICTFNGGDFAGIPGIVVKAPSEIGLSS